MRRFAVILAVASCVVACSAKQPGELKSYKDPTSGEITMMRDVPLGSVRVVGPEKDLADLLQVWTDDHLVFSSARTDTGALIGLGGAPAVIEATVDKAGKVTSMKWWGSKYLSIDTNLDGQADTRAALDSQQVEVWIDSQWKVRTTLGEGRAATFYVGDRQVSLTKDGWQ
jgi:hypothetical protein